MLLAFLGLTQRVATAAPLLLCASNTSPDSVCTSWSICVEIASEVARTAAGGLSWGPRKTAKLFYETIETFFRIVRNLVFRSFETKNQVGRCLRSAFVRRWNVAAGLGAIGRFQ